MKKKIKIIDNINKKTVVLEKEEPAKDHLAAQQKYPAKVFEDKRKKKPKYKKKYLEEFE